MDTPGLTKDTLEHPPSAPVLTQIGTPLKDQAERFRIFEESERRFRPDIYWYISFRCNLACAHCSVHSSPWVDTSDDLTAEECMQVVDQMAELEVRTALLTGGEFLLRPDAVAIMRALGERGIMVGLETNGIRFDSEFLELAKDLQSKKLFAMTVSLDGGTAETHERLRGPKSFQRTVRGLWLLKEQGIRFHVQCVLNGGNLHTIPDLYALARDLHPECVMVQWALLNPVGRGVGLVKELGLGREHIDVLFDTISRTKPTFPGYTLIKVPPAMVPPRHLPMVFKDSRVKSTMSCQFPLLGVLPNGDVTVCAVSRENEGLNFGNLRDGKFRLKNIWQKTRMDMLRSSYLGGEELSGICSDCVWKYSCKGGCRAWAYEEGGDFQAPFPICKALDEAGAFPKLYRLSHQNAAAVEKFRQMQVGCSCHG